MNQSDEHNFQDLKRLLKLKQHEVPPPGYFHNFSGNVISQIKAGRSQEAVGFMESLQERIPWLFNFIRLFEAKPGVVGGLATSLCVLMVFGLVLTENTGDLALSSPTFDAQAPSANQPSQMASAAGSSSTLLGSSSGGITVSTNPVTSLQPIFGQTASGSLFQQAGFAPGK